ncbi:HEAT repeat domain-containing protein [Streptomyces sp. NPDC058195]|uniref:HEAT repeat domain-containing protein n=1 Tax=Streptomyces sp. NPDC058195 TaxID=3346375 RepID=UPI0036E6FC97
MAMFVHLTASANAERVRRSGVRAASHGRDTDRSRGVYCFSVLPSYTLTHQWLRELSRRSGPRGLVAVHIRLPDDEPVTAGRYYQDPTHVTAAEAVRRIAALRDPRGWEVFVPRAVTRGEVHRVRTVRQVTGWRYAPDAHGTAPCTCFGCRVRGEYGSRRLRQRRPHPLDGPPPAAAVLLRQIAAAGDPGDPEQLVQALHWFGLRRRGPVDQLARLADHPDPEVRRALVWAIAKWRSPAAVELLGRLAQDPDWTVRDAAEYNAPEPRS